MRAEDTKVVATCLIIGAALVCFSLLTHKEISRPFRVSMCLMTSFIALSLIWYFRNINLEKELALLEKELALNEEILVAGNVSMPPFPQYCKPPPNSLKLFFGSGLAWATNFPFTLVRIAGDPILVIDSDHTTKNIKITVLKIFDDRNDIIARIGDDGFWVRNDTRKQRPDRSTLIIYDHVDTEVLRVQMLNSEAVSIQGKFSHPRIISIPLIITATYISLQGNTIASMCSGNPGVVFEIN